MQLDALPSPVIDLMLPTEGSFLGGTSVTCSTTASAHLHGGIDKFLPAVTLISRSILHTWSDLLRRPTAQAQGEIFPFPGATTERRHVSNCTVQQALHSRDMHNLSSSRTSAMRFSDAFAGSSGIPEPSRKRTLRRDCDIRASSPCQTQTRNRTSVTLNCQPCCET